MARLPRPFAFVKFTKEMKKWNNDRARGKYPNNGFNDYENELRSNRGLIFLGEIKNMKGHGIFLGYATGRIYSGYHIDCFEEMKDDEV